MDMKRILTSVIGLPLIILLLIFGNTTIIDIFFAIVALLGIHEYFDAFDKTNNAKPIRWIGYAVSISIAFLRMLHLKSSLIGVNEDMMTMMFVLIVVSIFVIFFHIINSGMKRNIIDGAVTIFGIIYVPVMLMFIPMLYASRLGKFLVWYIIICGWATDIFAYLAGKHFGRHKFSRISPNKSKEGCIAGAVRCCCSIYYIHNSLQYILLYKYFLHIHNVYITYFKYSWSNRRLCSI